MERCRKVATLRGALAFCREPCGNISREEPAAWRTCPTCPLSDPFRGLLLGGSQREARRVEDLLTDSTQSSFLGQQVELGEMNTCRASGRGWHSGQWLFVCIQNTFDFSQVTSLRYEGEESEGLGKHLSIKKSDQGNRGPGEMRRTGSDRQGRRWAQRRLLKGSLQRDSSAFPWSFPLRALAF